MRIITWNVNGVRSILGKGKDGKKLESPSSTSNTTNVLALLLKEQSPDILCLQEVRCNPDINIPAALDLAALGYTICNLNCSKVKKGYSGTCVISKKKPIAVTHGFGDEDSVASGEGRVITAEYEKFYLVNVYVPNSKPDLSRLDFRISEWEHAFRMHCAGLQSKKPLIVCGDFNVAPEDIDVHNPKSAKGAHGFTPQEKEAFKELLREAKLADSFRELNKLTPAYSWFSPFAKSRERNKGWRIDHILVSKKWQSKLEASTILGEYYGSDHVPCLLDLKMS